MKKGKLSRLLLAMVSVTFASALAAPTMAWALNGSISGSGTSANPYLIEDQADLEAFRDEVNSGKTYGGKYVKLVADVDLDGATWTPIKSFAGTFDGGDCRVSNFKLDSTAADAGFFGYIGPYPATVKNLTLSDVSGIAGANEFGVLAATAHTTVVSNVVIKGVKITTNNDSARVGGFFGYFNWTSASNSKLVDFEVDATEGAEFIGGYAGWMDQNDDVGINNVDVNGFKVVVADTDGVCEVGGFTAQTQTGWRDPLFQNCDVTGIDITATGTVDVAGFIADPGAHTRCTNCTVEGKIDVTGVTSAAYPAGGFFGDLGWNDDLGTQGGHKLTNCSADVDIVTKIAPAGGFIGGAVNDANAGMPASFTNCAAFGDITCAEGGTANIGGFVGEADRGAYTDCSASGAVVNNGAGYGGRFIGAAEKRQDIYITDCAYVGEQIGLSFIGNIAEDADVTVVNNVAKIGNERFATLQEAINAAKNGDIITLLADCDENVTISQAPDTKIVLDGSSKTFSGTITVDGRSKRYETAALTIKNIKFDASGITKDASVNLGGSNDIRYTSNVTVENCSFKGAGNAKVGIKQYTGGCHNLVVTGCTATGMHSLMQLKNVEKGLKVAGCKVAEGKNGISIGKSTGALVEDCEIAVEGYGVRADGEGAYTATVRDCSISADLPVVVRNVSGAYELTLEGAYELTASNADGYQVVFTTGDDGTYDEPAGIFDLVGADGLSVFPACTYVAKAGHVKYETLAEAVEAAGSEGTVELLADIAISEDTGLSGVIVNQNGKKITLAAGATLTAKNELTVDAVPGYYVAVEGDAESGYTYTAQPIPYIPPTLPETGCGEDAACNAFNDVDADAWYHEFVDWAVENGILRGYDDGSGNLGPEDTTLRAHVMVMLHRMAGEPEPAAAAAFNDVKAGAWYSDAITWAAEVGLTTGYTDGSGDFGPADVMTREQMATVLYRFAVLIGYDVSAGEDTNILSYEDFGEVSEYAIPAMQWAVGAGIIGGYTDADGEPTGFLGPKDDAERAHFAAMLMRMDEAYGIL